MSETYKIAILGGAFDPPTKGHLALADYVLRNTDTDYVWLMPCFQHKFGKEMSDPEYRKQMLRIALREHPGPHNICMKDDEIFHKLSGETIVLMEHLLHETKKMQIDWEFRIIIGMDNANSFHKWVRAEELREMVPFIVVPRVEEARDTTVDWYLKPPHVFLPDADLPWVSSTWMRNIIGPNDLWACEKLLVPGRMDLEVLKYIFENNLYKKGAI
jgi:nicotinate-nucleotide adenylyltransferase